MRGAVIVMISIERTFVMNSEDHAVAASGSDTRAGGEPSGGATPSSGLNGVPYLHSYHLGDKYV